MEAGLLLLRLAIGLTIAAHGAQKLFGWFGGHGLAGTGGWLESMGFRPGRLYALTNGVAELGGGLLLALGLATPLGAAAVAGVMFVAIATVHWSNGFFNAAGGYEFNIVLAIGALAIAFTGPGTISLDNVLDISLAGTTEGLIATGVAALSGLALLLARRLQSSAAAVPSH
jgi:putative oxidoreductase